MMRAGISNLDELPERIYLLPELIIAYHFKGILIYFRQAKVENLMTMFEKDYCLPQDQVEIQILDEYNKKCK